MFEHYKDTLKCCCSLDRKKPKTQPDEHQTKCDIDTVTYGKQKIESRRVTRLDVLPKDVGKKLVKH